MKQLATYFLFCLSLLVVGCSPAGLPPESLPEPVPQPTPGPVPAPQPAQEIYVSPSTLLLEEVGDSRTLTAQQVHVGQSEQSIVWTSSDPSVVSVTQDGKVTAIRLGHALVTATSSNGNSGRTTVVVADLKLGVIPVQDKTIRDDMKAVTGEGGIQFEVVFVETPPAVGSIVFGIEGKALMGRVVSTERMEQGYLVKLDTVPLASVFDNLDLNLQVDQLVELSGSSAINHSVNGKSLSKIGGFECSKTGDFDVASVEINPQINSSLGTTMRFAINDGKVTRFMVKAVGKVEVSLEGTTSIKLGATGKILCSGPKVNFRIPATIRLAGIWSLLFSPNVTAKSIFSIEGAGSSGLISLSATGKLTAEITSGFDWTLGGGVADLSSFTSDKALSVDILTPSENALEADIRAFAGGALDLGISSVIGGYDIIESQFGAKSSLNYKPITMQANDPKYESNYSMSITNQILPNENLRGVIEGLFSGALGSVVVEVVRPRIVFDAPIINLPSKISVDIPSSFVKGEELELEVIIEPDEMALGGVQFVKSLEVYTESFSVSGNLSLSKIASLPVILGKRSYPVKWSATNDSSELGKIFVFVKTSLPFLEFERKSLSLCPAEKFAEFMPSITCVIRGSASMRIYNGYTGRDIEYNFSELEFKYYNSSPLSISYRLSRARLDERIETYRNGDCTLTLSSPAREYIFDEKNSNYPFVSFNIWFDPSNGYPVGLWSANVSVETIETMTYECNGNISTQINDSASGVTSGYQTGDPIVVLPFSMKNNVRIQVPDRTFITNSWDFKFISGYYK